MSGQDDPTEEMVKAEIAAAVKILREDGVHISKTVGSLFEKFQGTKTEPPAEPPKPGEGDPPPKKDPPAEPPTKSGLWWGTRSND